MTDHVHIEPSPERRRAFARWALEQTPQIQTSSSTGSDVPLDLYPDVPPELLEGAFVDGFLYNRADEPQKQVTPAAKSDTAPMAIEPLKTPQKAAQAPVKKARKRPSRPARKTGDTRLRAERIAAEAETDPTDDNREDSSTDSADA